MAEELYLPVSLGEALDKLSILDIKLLLVSNENKRKDVKIEYDMIYNKLKIYIERYSVFYNMIKKVNLYIWHMMDELRDGNLTDDLYVKICRETIIANDMRFRVKDKINKVSKSLIKEQKSYNVLRAKFNIQTLGIDINNLIRILHYYSLIYDELYIICFNEHLSLLESEFRDQSVIITCCDNNTTHEFKNIYNLSQENNKTIYNKLGICEEIVKKFI